MAQQKSTRYERDIHVALIEAVRPALDKITNNQYSMVNSSIRPDAAVSAILDMEKCKDRILARIDSTMRLIHDQEELASIAVTIAKGVL